MLSHSLSRSDQAAGNLAHSNEWKPSFKQLHVRSSRGCLWLAPCLLLISYLSFLSFPACEYTKHKSLLFLLEKQQRSFSGAEIRGMIRNMFCFVPAFSKESVLQTSPLGAPVAGWLSVLKQFWVYSFMCPANNRPRLKGCQLVGSSSREASASLPTYPGYPYPTYPTYPNRLCPIWQQPTSCCQPRSLEISGVQCQEDSSVLKYWSSVLST